MGDSCSHDDNVALHDPSSVANTGPVRSGVIPHWEQNRRPSQSIAPAESRKLAPPPTAAQVPGRRTNDFTGVTFGELKANRPERQTAKSLGSDHDGNVNFSKSPTLFSCFLGWFFPCGY